MVDINEFCRLLRVERSPFVERLFSMFDSDRTGLIDLKEFVVGLSNVGTEARENKVKVRVPGVRSGRIGSIDSSNSGRSSRRLTWRARSSSTGRWSSS